MRIVAGAHRGAKIITSESRELRPTSDRVRESLFNILDGGRYLNPYRQKLVIDAFAGTGALGLEAISRGASHVIFLEQAVSSLKVLFQNIRLINAQDKTTVITGDAAQFGQPSNERAGLVMLDPPYQSQMGISCIKALKYSGWIGPETLIVLEHSSREKICIPEWIKILDNRKYGLSHLTFMQEMA
jgi:16S rRNA (guanine966-N2)-methyltransferase